MTKFRRVTNRPRDRASNWSTQEIETAARMWQDLVIDRYGDQTNTNGAKTRACMQIAAAIGRDARSVFWRYQHAGPSFRSTSQANWNLPLHLLAARDARSEAYDARDLTGAIMGDPPKGFSALDRRRA